MLKPLLRVLSVVMVLSIMLSAQQAEYVPGELLVQMKPGTTASSLALAFATDGVSVQEQVSDIMNVYLIAFDPSKKSEQEILYQVRMHPAVQVAQFNHYISLRKGFSPSDMYREMDNMLSTMPNDPRFGEQWALHNTGQSGGLNDADIDAPEAWDFTKGGLTSLGDTIVVAVVDGGFDLAHNDLNFWKNWQEIPGNGIDDDGNGYIDDVNGWNAYNNNGNVTDDDHGTHVAGIVGARGNNSIGVSGVNWNVKVMAIQGSSSTEATVIRAYTYALKNRMLYNQTNGAKGAFIVVTNASFGVDYGQPANFPLWCAMYDSLGKYGILSCGATANLNVNVDLQGDIPTACPSEWLITVTNTTRTDTKNSGAGYGKVTIDLGAPGTSVLNTLPGNTYGSLTGTSMATPTVAGAVALMFAAANPNFMQSYKANLPLGASMIKQFLLDGTDSISALANITVTDGRLNVYKAILPILTPPDTVAPTQVTNLLAGSPTSTSLTLQWTAPLDTSVNGVVGYNIRYSTQPILDITQFNAATLVPYNGTPKAPGQPEQLSVSGLQFGTQYYFAMRSFDTWGNQSLLSNPANATTWAAPQLSVSPDSVSHISLVNQVFSDSVRIENTSASNSTLEYSVLMANNTFPQNSVQVQLVPGMKATESFNRYTKDEPEVVYGSSIEGSGGPDLFGYEWIDSNNPYGPQFTWEDISTTGTAVTTWTPTGTYNAKDEGYAGPFAIPFNFKFYGVAKSQLYISSNGFVTFAPITANTITNNQIPSTAIPNDMIAAFFDDLDGSAAGTVYTKAESNRFVIQYTNWYKYSSTNPLTFQVILYSSGRVHIYYKTMSGTLNSATVGIENAAGNDGLQVAYNANYVANNLALRFQADPEWVTSANNSGMLYAGNHSYVKLNFISTDLALGSYTMDLIVNTNAPVNGSDTVKVAMTVSNEIPVELTSFTAATERNSVILQWNTATETNNAGFAIERSEDGRSWSEIAFVKGNGTTTNRVSYSFRDGQVKAGTYQYRLKQVDYSGTFAYSTVITAAVGVPVEFALMQNYPNPFNPSTVIEFALPKDETVSLKVYNAIGEMVAELVNSKLNAGYHSTVWDASSVPSGIYYCRISAGEYSSVKKMMLVK